MSASLKPNIFGSNARKTNLRYGQRFADQAAALPLKYFDFQNFPRDIAIEILVLAIATSAYWRTYQSLVVVSSEMQALVYEACLPYLPVMLHTKRHVDSFCSLLASHPDVGPRIRALWFIAGVKANVERTTGLSILKECTGITHLSCRINLLKAMVLGSETLVPRDLKDLTLVETIVPWHELLPDHQPAARQLFQQVTHLRVSGGTEFMKPYFCFTSLSHLSFSCHDLTSLTSHGMSSTTTSPFDPSHFPVLQQVVPSIPYLQWRTKDPKKLHASGLAMDSRITVLTCPKKWKEADIWETARRGGKDLWKRADCGEYLEKSRAFTSLPRQRYNDDYDDYDYGWDSEEYGPFGGESGL